ncbi:MAG: hypothetical protein ACC641_05160 [Acidiferrobacterales bacterium]
MPVDIQYQTNPTGVVLVYSGDITGNDIINVNDEIAGCQDCVYQLSDFTAVAHLKISVKEMHRIAIQDCSIPPHYKLMKSALVGNMTRYAMLTDLYYLFLEVWVGKQCKYKTKSFDNVEQARQWIGI